MAVKQPFMQTNCHLNNTETGKELQILAQFFSPSFPFRKRDKQPPPPFDTVKYGELFSIISHLIFDNMRKIYLKEFSAKTLT